MLQVPFFLGTQPVSLKGDESRIGLWWNADPAVVWGSRLIPVAAVAAGGESHEAPPLLPADLPRGAVARAKTAGRWVSCPVE